MRLGLAGGGTDLSPYCDSHGGAVLNTTIDLYAYATLSVGGPQVQFRAADTGQELSFEVGAEAAAAGGALPLHQAVYRRVVGDFLGGKPIGCALTTHCEAPPGSGLGSSSTLVVAMLKAFCEALSLPLGEYDLAHLAYEIERHDAGMAGGRQDQYAASFGGVNFIEFFAEERVIVNPLRVKSWILAELESSIVLFHTGVSRQSATIIAEQTSNLIAGTGKPLEAMHELKRDAFAMKEALLKGEVNRIAQILNSSWDSKRRTAANVSSDRIDTVMAVAREAGAKAGKVSGAGGGGFITFIVDPTQRSALIRALLAAEGTVMACSLTNNGAESWRLE